MRLHDLPYAADPSPGNPLAPSIGQLGCRHLRQLVSLSGRLLKAGPLKVFQAQRMYECNKCKTRCGAGCNGGDSMLSGQLHASYVMVYQPINQVHGTVASGVLCGSPRFFSCASHPSLSFFSLRFVLRCSLEQGSEVQLPEACPRADRPCGGTNFRHVTDAPLWSTYQVGRGPDARCCAFQRCFCNVSSRPAPRFIMFPPVVICSCEYGV